MKPKSNGASVPSTKGGSSVKKAKKKLKKKKGGTSGRMQVRGHKLFGGSNFASNTTSVPAAFDNLESNLTYVSSPTSVRHPYLGIDGISITGCQPFANVVTTASDSQLWTGTALATTSSVNIIALSTDELNGPEAAIANLHQKYVFRDILIEYVSAVATSQSGAFALAFVNDGSGLAAPSSFATAREVVPNVVIPFRHDRGFLHYHYDGYDTWYTLLDSATSAGTRQTRQGLFIGFPSASSIGAVAQGFLNVWYVLELYQPISSQGFTVQVSDKSERDLVRAYIRSLREASSMKTRYSDGRCAESEEDSKRGSSSVDGYFCLASTSPSQSAASGQSSSSVDLRTSGNGRGSVSALTTKR